MKHAKTITRRIARPLLPQKAMVIWCDGMIDGFCYSIDCQDGMKGITLSGGIAGISEFHPLFPSLKC